MLLVCDMMTSVCDMMTSVCDMMTSVCSAKQLVRGEPNVSYICSRYYRAPELIFGATDYTSQIGTCHLYAHSKHPSDRYMSPAHPL